MEKHFLKFTKSSLNLPVTWLENKFSLQMNFEFFSEILQIPDLSYFHSQKTAEETRVSGTNRGVTNRITVLENTWIGNYLTKSRVWSHPYNIGNLLY